VDLWSGIVSLMPRPLCLKWKEHAVPVEWGLGGPQSWSGKSAGIPVCCDSVSHCPRIWNGLHMSLERWKLFKIEISHKQYCK
jgi:hypothetical protein